MYGITCRSSYHTCCRTNIGPLYDFFCNSHQWKKVWVKHIASVCLIPNKTEINQKSWKRYLHKQSIPVMTSLSTWSTRLLHKQLASSSTWITIHVILLHQISFMKNTFYVVKIIMINPAVSIYTWYFFTTSFYSLPNSINQHFGMFFKVTWRLKECFFYCLIWTTQNKTN